MRTTERAAHLRAVLDAALEHLCDGLGGAVLALQVRQGAVQGLLAREDADGVLQDGARRLHAAPVQTVLRRQENALQWLPQSQPLSLECLHRQGSEKLLCR